MKTKIHLLVLILISSMQNFAQMECKTVFGASPVLYEDNCPGYSIFYPKKSNQVTNINVNYIFLQPPTGPGRWDTVTLSTCIGQINFLNYQFGKLANPSKVLPINPPIFVGDAKIRFTLKNMVKIKNPAYSASPVWNTFNTDSNALNIIFGCHPSIYGYGVVPHLFSNELFIIDTTKLAPLENMMDTASLKLLSHEIGHCLGLSHTGVYPASNPFGTILKPFPENDYWYEDTATWSQSTLWDPFAANNIMGYCWGCSDYLSPNQIYTMHKALKFDPVVKKWLIVMVLIPRIARLITANGMLI